VKHSQSISAPHRYLRLYNFEKKACPVFDSAAVGIGALVATILEKLIWQIVVGGMQFDSVEACGFREFGGFAIVFDQALDFGNIERSMRRGLDPTTRGGNAGLGIKPIGRNNGRRYGM
jgi:hypothetical protein